MATARTKQLEDKLARYERIMSGCRRCKVALASEEVEDGTPPSVPDCSAGSSGQAAPKVSANTSAPSSSKEHMPPTQKGQINRSSKQNTSTSRSKYPPSAVDLANTVSSTSASARRREIVATGPSRDTMPPLNRSSKPSTAKTVPSLPDSSLTEHISTTHSLGLRPTSLEPSTSSAGTPSVRLDTSGHDPAMSDSNTGRPQNDLHKQPDWVVSASKMLREVPLGWIWREKLLKADQSMLAAVATDTTATQDDAFSAVVDTQDNDLLLRLVRSFAHRHSDKRLNFQHFLLVCLCKVLSTQKVSQRSLVEVLRICISDTSNKNIGRYLSGATWMNEIMDRLFFAGWGYRSIDLMVICMCGGNIVRAAR